MVSMKEVEAQLKRIGVQVRFWGAAEVRELQHILMSNEQIVSCLNGRYEGGFATLVATDHRLLLIDKKPLYLTIGDIRYDMIAEVDYNARLLDATVCVMTFNKTLRFTSIRQKRLRELTKYVQRRVMEVRQQHLQQNHEQTSPIPAMFQPQTAAQPSAHPYIKPITKFNPINPYTRAALTMRRHYLPTSRKF